MEPHKAGIQYRGTGCVFDDLHQKGKHMTTIDSLERFLEVELQAWSGKDKTSKSIQRGPVIAITRQPGCDGESIAKTLAKKLGLVLYDWEIVEQIAKDTHVSQQVVATLGEQLRSELDDWLTGFGGTTRLSSHEYLQCLRKVLFTIAIHGNAVILGRGANFLIPSEKKTLGLCLVAPIEVRTANIMQTLKLSREETLKHIVRTERDQRLWIRKYGHADVNDDINYHMVINTALVTEETIVQLVKEIVRARS